jgi:CRP/FNR family transcriptional regulator
LRRFTKGNDISDSFAGVEKIRERIMDKLAFLRNTPLFEGVDEGTVAEVGQYVFEKRLKRGETVTNEGGKASAMYFVAEGVMKIYKTSAEGKEQILSLMRPGDFLNEVLLDNGPAMADAETSAETHAKALGVVLLYGIQKARLRSAMHRQPKIANNMLNMLTGRIRHLISLVEDLSFRTVSSRVAKILLVNAQMMEKERLTQRDMAAIAGTAREVVSRSLRYLDDRGLIEMRRQRIVIKDVAGLKEMAGRGRR